MTVLLVEVRILSCASVRIRALAGELGVRGVVLARRQMQRHPLDRGLHDLTIVDASLQVAALVQSWSRAASAMNGAGGCWPCSGVRRRIASAGVTLHGSTRPLTRGEGGGQSAPARVRTRIAAA